MLLPFLSVPSATAIIVPQTLKPIEDAYVDQINPSANYGGMSSLKVYNSGNMFVGECLAYLKFNLSEIPAGISVESAKLRLYATIFVTSTHQISAFYSSDNTWTEFGITYDNRPSFKVTSSSTTTVSSPSKWYEWDVTTDVQATLGTLGKKITIVLKSDYYEGADWVWFESRDQQYTWMQGYMPELVISYSSGSNGNTTSPVTLEGPIIGISVTIGIVLGVVLLAKYRKKPKKTEVPLPPPKF
jgi:hypothetical protein